MAQTLYWTYTDEAPALATFALLPVVKRFTDPAGLSVELSDISVSGRIIAAFPERLSPEQRQRDELGELGELAKTNESLPYLAATSSSRVVPSTLEWT